MTNQRNRVASEKLILSHKPPQVYAMTRRDFLATTGSTVLAGSLLPLFPGWGLESSNA